MCGNQYAERMLVRCFLLVGVVSALGPTAKTTWGTLQGIEQSTLSDAPFYTTCDAFLGVPYARPPTGDLRFENPAAWNETYANGKRDAAVYGAACPQSAVAGTGSEDCLTLNVWRPTGTKPGDKLPIMTFIHGGAFVEGSGGGLAPNLLLNAYSGCALAGRYKMVVATVNYRLGPFGFLFTQGADGTTSGNFGIKDQREALRWLMREADNFGADAATHTIFGESAGAISVLHHAVSPLSRGLFQRVISESGFPLAVTQQYGVTNTRGFAKLLGCTDADGDALRACLRTKSKEAILSAAQEGVDPFTSSDTWSPTVDGHELSDMPQRLWKRGDARDVQVMLGTNTDEGVLFVYPYNPLGIIGVTAWEQFVAQDTNSHDPVQTLNTTALARVRELYNPGAFDNRAQASAVVTDSTFLCGSQFVARQQHAAGGSGAASYLYRFDHRAPCLSAFDLVEPGVFHTLELPFVFGTPLSADCLLTPAEDAFVGLMGGLWTSFAKTGKPSWPGAKEWPAYSDDRENIVLRTVGQGGLQVEKDYRSTYCKFWDSVWYDGLPPTAAN